MMKIIIFENCGQLGHVTHLNRGFWPKKHNETTHYSLELSTSSISSNLLKFHELVNMYQMFYII